MPQTKPLKWKKKSIIVTQYIMFRHNVTHVHVNPFNSKKYLPNQHYVITVPALYLGPMLTTELQVLTSWWRHQMESFSALLAICAGIHRAPANSPHKGQWRGALMFSLICVWINGWVNNREAGDLRRYRAHYDIIVMLQVYLAINDSCRSCWLDDLIQNALKKFHDFSWYFECWFVPGK